MVKAKELIHQSTEELIDSLQEMNRQHYHLVNELKTNKKLDKPHRLRQLKKDKARILTVLNSKKCQQKNK